MSEMDIMESHFQMLLKWSATGFSDVKHELCGKKTTLSLVEESQKLYDKVKGLLVEEEDQKKKYNNYNRLITWYMREVWVKERFNVEQGETTFVTGKLLESVRYRKTNEEVSIRLEHEATDELKKVIPSLNEEKANKLIRRAKNTIKTCKEYFEYQSTEGNTEITVKEIVKINALLTGKDDPSEDTDRRWFRTFDPDSTLYIPYETIEVLLSALLKQVREALRTQNYNNKIGYCATLGAYFVEWFLRIHPFEEGNGRTARFVFSLIMKHFGIGPISLFSGHIHDYVENHGHYKAYISSLNRQRNILLENNPKNQFARYSIECSYTHLWYLNEMFNAFKKPKPFMTEENIRSYMQKCQEEQAESKKDQ